MVVLSKFIVASMDAEISGITVSMPAILVSFSFNYSAMFAALVMCITPTVVMYVLLQEQIMESMVAGSVKG